MKCFKVENGDLVLGAGNRLLFADFKSKLIQDLTIWMLETYGIGFSTPNFGSNLDTFIGQASPQLLAAQVQTEVARIVGLYQTQQQLMLQQSASTNQLSNWSKSQIIQQINSIQAIVQGVQIAVQVTLTTLAGVATSLQATISSAGITIS